MALVRWKKGCDIWYADYSVKDPLTGRRRRVVKSLGTADKRAAKSLHDELVGKAARVKVGLEKAPEQWPDVSELVKAYLMAVSSKRNPRTAVGYKCILRHVLDALGVVNTAEITPEKVETYQRGAEGRISGATLNSHVRTLQQLLNFGVRTSRIPHNPILYVEGVDYESKEHYVVTTAERDTLLAAVKDRDAKDAITFVAFTGIRAEQLRSLRWGDVQMIGKHCRLSIRRSLAKNKTAWMLPLNATAADVLRSRRPKAADPEAVIFLNRFGARWGKSLLRHLREAAVEAGIIGVDVLETKVTRRRRGRDVEVVKRTRILRYPRNAEGRALMLNLHSLRHAFGSHVMEAGGTVKEVQHLLQHKTASVTVNRYLHASAAGVERATQAIVANIPQTTETGNVERKAQ